MSGLAVFSLKYQSLLQFDQHANEEGTIRHNLRSLFGVRQAPSDSGLRKRLDDVDPRSLRPAFKRVFRALQRGKALEEYAYWDGHYLLSIDGTGTFSSRSVHCANCCEKHHRDGSVEYYHQMLAAVVVHPEHREVFPLAPEPIQNTDGATKNDREREAAKRLIADVRREHPHPVTITLLTRAGFCGMHDACRLACDSFARKRFRGLRARSGREARAGARLRASCALARSGATRGASRAFRRRGRSCRGWRRSWG